MSDPLPGNGPRFRVRWAHGADPPIAEVAEALGVPTDAVMAMTAGPRGSRVTVLFSKPSDERDPPAVFGQFFERDADGILRPVSEPREIPGMLDGIRRGIESGELRRPSRRERRRKPPKLPRRRRKRD